MAEEKIESIVDALKEIIDKNGPKYLTDAPYSAYTELIELKMSLLHTDRIWGRITFILLSRHLILSRQIPIRM